MEPIEQPDTTPRPDATERDPGEPAADKLDLDAVERDLDEVERTLDRLADGTYWSEHEPHDAAIGATDEHPGTPA